jgi:hypothetical protein
VRATKRALFSWRRPNANKERKAKGRKILKKSPNGQTRAKSGTQRSGHKNLSWHKAQGACRHGSLSRTARFTHRALSPPTDREAGNVHVSTTNERNTRSTAGHLVTDNAFDRPGDWRHLAIDGAIARKWAAAFGDGGSFGHEDRWARY